MKGDRSRELGPGIAGKPWFVQFWPLFIFLLMLISIAASVATVVIAYHHADEDVRGAGAIREGVP